MSWSGFDWVRFLSGLEFYADQDSKCDGGDAEEEAAEGVEEEGGVVARLDQAVVFKSEGGKRGESTAESGNEQETPSGAGFGVF